MGHFHQNLMSYFKPQSCLLDNRDLQQTAFHSLTGSQTIKLFVILVLLAAGLIYNWHLTLVVIIALLTFLYFADLLFYLYLIYRSFAKSAEIQISKEELEAASKKDWPSYTILCPLYKEWKIIPQFIASMNKLDYPKDKLQIMLILEEDDLETIKHLQQYDLPKYYKIIIVPHSLPKTKPKACNYGLKFATGEYSVIYDAEDVPEPLQLKKAVLAFEKTRKQTVCIQAKLNFYNPSHNLLTRVFAVEYSTWFDLVLTGLQSLNAPIPLGGTSNHFKTSVLHKLGGWDAFNVTEDADLGMRLARHGYQTAIIDSLTLEEANSNMKNWFWQRTRWIKGYIQTYLVHTRGYQKGNVTHHKWRLDHGVMFRLVVGGKVLVMFINPFLWVLVISYFAFRPIVGATIESFYPLPILYMGAITLFFGNFLYLYYHMIGCVHHKHHKLTIYVFLVPLYWLAMSAAAWRALYEIFTRPYHWSKTRHGFHLDLPHVMREVETSLAKVSMSTPAQRAGASEKGEAL